VTDRVDYDEFGLFHENAEEYGLPFDRTPTVRRVFADVDPVDSLAPASSASSASSGSRGRRLSALVWQDRDPELVLLHGGSQNAHTWALWETLSSAPDAPHLNRLSWGSPPYRHRLGLTGNFGRESNLHAYDPRVCVS